MPERCLTFPCCQDTLVGILHEPEADARDLGILIVVGGPQYRVGSHRQFVLMARQFAAGGYPVFRFDYRGMGDASGDSRTFESINDDIRAAMEAFRAATPALRGMVIFGLCDAASASLMYCLDDSSLVGLMLANPWVRTEAGQASALVKHYYRRRLLQRAFWRKLLRGELHMLRAVTGFVGNWRAANGRRGREPQNASQGFTIRMLRGAERFSGPMLVLLSDKDLTAREFADLCRSDPGWAAAMSRGCVTQVRLTDSDHTFSTVSSQNRAAAECISWLNQLNGARGASTSSAGQGQKA